MFCPGSPTTTRPSEGGVSAIATGGQAPSAFSTELGHSAASASLPVAKALTACSTELGLGAGGSAKPQRILRNDKLEEVWPQYWGISLAQCRDLMQRCRQDPKWDRSNSVYTLVNDYVKPWTMGSGLGYAVMVNQEAPKEVTIMISHAWRENAEEFFETLERTCKKDDVMFICALSLYQCEDGAGPTIAEQIGCSAEESPFRRVLEHIAGRGHGAGWVWRWQSTIDFVPGLLLMIAIILYFFPMGAASCIPALHGCAEGRLILDQTQWIYLGKICLFPHWEFHYKELPPEFRHCVPLTITFLTCAALARVFIERSGMYRGRMIVVPNRECDLYSRLWCCYEIFVAVEKGVPVKLAKTLASAGQGSCRDATCSSQEDQDQIFCDIGKAQASDLSTGFRRLSSVSSAASGRLRSFSGFSDSMWSRGTSGTSDPEKAYDMVDRAIRLTTTRASRSANVAMLWWLLPFLLMSLALPKGDWLTAHQMFDSPVCSGVYSMALSGVTLLLIAFTVAKRQGGVLSFKSAICTSVGIFGTGIALRVFDHFFLAQFQQSWSPTNFPPFHHCFTLGLLCGGAGMAVLTVSERLTCGRFISWRYRTLCLAVVAPSVLAVLMVCSAAEPTIAQYYPVAVWYVSFRFAPIYGFPAFLWTAAARWGVRIRR